MQTRIYDSEKSKMELPVSLANGWKMLTNVRKSSNLDVAEILHTLQQWTTS